MFNLFNKKVPIFLQDEKDKPVKINILNLKEDDYRFRIFGKEFKALDYNSRSRLFRFENFVIVKVANDRKNYVAYEIVDGDLELIKTAHKFQQVIQYA